MTREPRAAPGFGVVEEWVASPPLRPSTFVPLSRTVLDGETRSPQLAQVRHTHGIDAVVVAPDDSLFVSVGDDALNNGDPQTLRAQDLDQPYGKLLHLTPAGSGVPSNPFYNPANPTSWRSMVYAYGLRNPFRFSLDPRSGMPIAGDVGWLTHEEINTLPPGANAGWPCFEGMSATTFSPASVCKALSSARSARMPIWTYPHAGSGAAVVGGMHYTGSSYPAQYQGAYFFGDYTRKQLWTLRTDATGKLTRAPETNGFASYAGAPVAFHPGPNGDVTYADLLRGYVRRLVHTTGNRAPTAQFATTTNAANRTVSLSATDSYDLDGDELTFQWEFGDGTSAAGETATHTYGGTKDAFDVTLTVKDQLGAVGRSTVKVYPDNRTPTLTLDEPAPSRTYSVNDTVQLSASATDPEDGALTVEWDTALLHCPFAGSCHRHPESAETGPSYSAPFTDHGADTTMLVTARAVDSKGATITASYEARPRVRTLAINSPVAVSVNGELGASAEVVAGSEVQVSAPTSSGYWRFQSWSDDGAAVHSFTMPDADLTACCQVRDRHRGQVHGPGSQLVVPGHTHVTRVRSCRWPRPQLHRGAPLLECRHRRPRRSWSRPCEVPGGWRSGSVRIPHPRRSHPFRGQASYFSEARIYWSAASGAHVVRGPILAKYLAAGGPEQVRVPDQRRHEGRRRVLRTLCRRTKHLLVLCKRRAPHPRPDPDEVCRHGMAALERNPSTPSTRRRRRRDAPGGCTPTRSATRSACACADRPASSRTTGAPAVQHSGLWGPLAHR